MMILFYQKMAFISRDTYLTAVLSYSVAMLAFIWLFAKSLFYVLSFELVRR